MVNVNEQYYSGNQATLFIGDVWVDDIISIDYTLQHSRMPQYGYGSQHFDFLPKGSILITGSFTINFREPNYLWIILERYKHFNKTKEERTFDREKLEIENKAVTYSGDERVRLEEFFGAEDPSKAQESLIAQAREFDKITEPIGPENFNHKAFNILLGYGYELNKNSPGETLRSVHIMGKSKLINADGRPISEQYNFIARSIS